MEIAPLEAELGLAHAPAPKGQVPVLVTSCGQSPGPVRVNLFLKRLGIDYPVLRAINPKLSKSSLNVLTLAKKMLYYLARLVRVSLRLQLG